MRTLTAICVATFLVGCGEQPQWQRTTHSLTPIQIDRQQELINDGQLLFEYPSLAQTREMPVLVRGILANDRRNHGDARHAKTAGFYFW